MWCFLQMEALLPKFELNPTTWVYITSIALVGFFFKFNRLMSVRNLDLAALIGLAPGLLLVSGGREAASQGMATGEAIEASGFFVLLGVGLFFLGRLVADLFMTRRPLLEANLSQGGLTWIGFALFVFLAAAILTTHYQGVVPHEGIVPPAGQEAAQSPLKFAILDLFP